MNEYYDEAISGTKLRRNGLNQMLRDAEAGKLHVLYFHSLSRLARESVITMPLLKRLVYKFGVRVISVTEGIDSDRDGWELIASILSVMHERYIDELAANVLRGQEGTVLAGYSVGDWCFGYSSEPVLGTQEGRSGRNAKPRMMYVTDPETAAWVVRIYYWFVIERRSLRWIARELNRRNAPKDHRATTKDWHTQQVRNLLSNTKYKGVWPWGEMKNIRDPETGQIRQEPRSEQECKKWRRQLKHLRLVDDETFDKAQNLLDENYQKYAANRRTDGTFKSGGSTANGPRHLIQGLMWCGECGSKLYVGGTGSKYMFCPNYENGTCSCQTKLRRDRAERMILDAIGKRILADSSWVETVYELTLNAWQQQAQHAPTELAAAERALGEVKQKIARLLDAIENGCADPDVGNRVQERREKRAELEKEVERLKRADENRVPKPTKEWVREQLLQLGESMKGDTPAAAYALRDLVGGRIEVAEIRKKGRKRFYLQCRFTIHAGEVVGTFSDICVDDQPVPSNSECLAEEIVIDLVEPNPLDAEAELARPLYEQRMLNCEIGRHFGWSKSKVTKVIRHMFELRGEPMPDGRTRRSTLDCKHVEHPMYQRIAEEVKRLATEGLLFSEIAGRLKCDIATLRKAWVFWHTSRGIEIPDGRERRKSLTRKTSRSRRSETGDEDNVTSAA